MRSRTLVRGRAWIAAAGCALLVALVAVPSPAEAAYPGSNGKIVFERHVFEPVDGQDIQIWTMNADGTGQTQLTTGDDLAFEPEWSPDGTKIAYTRRPLGADHEQRHVRVMNADGTGDHQAIPAWSYAPTWSPDGERLAFVAPYFDSAGCSCLVYEVVEADLDGANRRTIAVGKFDFNTGDLGPVSHMEWSPNGDEIIIQDGDYDTAEVVAVDVATGAKHLLAGDPCCYTAWPGGWSPGAGKVAFIRDGFGENDLGIYTMNRDGSGLAEVTGPNNPNAVEWSPDETKLVFEDDFVGSGDGSDIYSANVDGSGETRLTSGGASDSLPDWQPIPVNAYPRPKGASPTQVSLVPAYEPCTSANRAHGPPLAFPSCNPPAQAPGQLTVGTPDANGHPAKSVSYLRVNPLRGDPSTPADEADVRLRAIINDVRVASDLSDYTGDLEARLTVQITDKDNTPHPGGPGAATVQGFTHSQPISCTATGDTTVGSTCELDTTVEALVPGAVTELTRAIWELGAIRVHDGAGNLFMTQGIFVP